MKYMDTNKQLSTLSSQFNPKRHCLNCGKPLDETNRLCSDCVMVANLFIG
jgi:predicted amidophosphoribosyltransferase